MVAPWIKKKRIAAVADVAEEVAPKATVAAPAPAAVPAAAIVEEVAPVVAPPKTNKGRASRSTKTATTSGD